MNDSFKNVQLTLQEILLKNSVKLTNSVTECWTDPNKFLG